MGRRGKGFIAALVARSTTVLAEASLKHGNHMQICEKLLVKINSSASSSNFKSNDGTPLRRAYSFDRYIFCYEVTTDGLVFMCVADSVGTKHKTAFAFLTEIRKRWLSEFRAGGTRHHQMQNQFSRTLKDRMLHYTEKGDKIDAIMDDVEEVKQVMISNIDKTLERGERIETLVDKTDLMAAESRTFKKKTTTLRRHSQWKLYKMNMIICLVALSIAYTVAAVLCGWRLGCVIDWDAKSDDGDSGAAASNGGSGGDDGGGTSTETAAAATTGGGIGGTTGAADAATTGGGTTGVAAAAAATTTAGGSTTTGGTTGAAR